MTATNLRHIAAEVRDSLTWPITEKTHEINEVRLVSYPYKMTHTLVVPEGGVSDETLLPYLRELGRAVLCETVHPVFAGVHFLSNHAQKRFLMPVVPALTAACDLFASQWLLDRCQTEARQALEEQLAQVEEAMKDEEPPTTEFFLYMAMVVALAINTLGEPIDCGGPLDAAVDAFLAVLPDQPSAEACLDLVNRLLALYSDQQVRVIDDGAFGLWELYVPDATPTAAA
ncbi:MAG TPA: hypothetical protein VIU41_05745 [Geobacteraceae bacterium]